MSNHYEDDRPKCLRTVCFANYDCYCSALSNNDFGERDCPFFKTRRQLDEERAAIKARMRDKIRTEFRMDVFTGTHKG